MSEQTKTTEFISPLGEIYIRLCVVFRQYKRDDKKDLVAKLDVLIIAFEHMFPEAVSEVKKFHEEI